MTTKRLLVLSALLSALSIPPVQAQTEVVLYNFAHTKGAVPYGGVIRDSAGNLYGTAQKGGTAGKGVVYRLDKAGRYKVLYNFTASTGAGPDAAPVRDSAGNLYGTTPRGGGANQGAVYKLDAAGQVTLLHGFTGGADGGNPAGGVILDSAGHLYGTALNGGASGTGAVFQLDTAGNETVLYSFTGGADGAYPQAGVIRDSAGNLYGTASSGGAANAGVVYELDTAGNETVLYTFTGGADGKNPNSGVIRDSASNLYGTTVKGGATGAGTVYKLNTAGNETVLYSFTGGDDGGAPFAGVIRDSAGNLYGTAYEGGTGESGVVYKVDTAGNETVLYTFTGGYDGDGPYAGVTLDSAGDLYGTTISGGKKNRGVVFEIKP